MKKCLNQKRNKEALRILRNAGQLCKYNIGDVLISYDRNDKPMMQNENMVQRWVVVNKDDRDVLFAKKMMINGNLGTGIYLLAEVRGVERFDIDPDFLDLILLGKEDEYNPAKINREIANKRTKLRKINAQKKVTWEGIKQAQDVIDEWSVGQNLWYCRTNTPNSNQINKYVIHKIEKTPIDYNITRESNWRDNRGYPSEERQHRKQKLTHVYNVTLKLVSGSHYRSEITISDSNGSYYLSEWYLVTPSTVEMI